MGIQFEEQLSPKEKDKRALKYKTWLQENGYLDDTAHKTLLEAQGLLNELQYELDKTEGTNEAMSKLAAHTQELLTSIKI